jgi:hypothetical protein
VRYRAGMRLPAGSTIALLTLLLPLSAAADGPAKPSAPPDPTAVGTDFATEVRVLYRIAACGASEEPVPERFSAKAIAEHCRDMAGKYASYRKAWVDKAKPFIAELRPRDLPTTVVYPFGGGDLSSALTVYPDATELTTISLEAAGDVRVIDSINRGTLSNDLETIGHDVGRLYQSAHSTTKSLQAASHSKVPGTVMFALAGLVVHDMEPVGLRYFELADDGSVHYLTNEELDRNAAAFAEAHKGKSDKKPTTHFWYEQDSPFGNVEIRFRPRGDAQAPVRTYRHIVANLDDAHNTADPRVLRHLAAKGKVAVMTKAASFLLWYDDFTQIRGYLLDHVAWMISDASGIPPSYAGPAGFEQVTYGEFDGPYFVIDPKGTRKEFIKLWKDQPHHDLPFRFGYPDNAKHGHLMITRPKAP